MNETNLETIEIEPEQTARYAVIWLHGLGADGNDFVPIVPELGLPEELPIRFVFPHAPMRAVTINMGMTMRAWYDIRGMDRSAAEDLEGIRASTKAVHNLIAKENQRGIAATNIILAGFSQGGAVALHTALRYPERLAGIMALSTYLPQHESLAAEKSDANAKTPIFMAHGSQDPMVPQSFGTFSRERLEEQGYDVEWHSYPMQHQVCMEEIKDIATWLRKILNADPS